VPGLAAQEENDEYDKYNEHNAKDLQFQQLPPYPVPIVVKGCLEGQGPFNGLVDAGASHMLVHP